MEKDEADARAAAEERERRRRDRRGPQITIFDERRLGDRRRRRLGLLNRVRLFLGLTPLE